MNLFNCCYVELKDLFRKLCTSDQAGLKDKYMKSTLFLVALALTTLSVQAQMRTRDPRSVPTCPMASSQFLKVTNFVDAHSADGRFTKGICTLLTPKYSWWETMPSQKPHFVEVAATCSRKDLVRHGNIFFAKAYVSYQLETDDCRSNPGCYFTCNPLTFIRF
jgi:hypothetical protein